MNLFFITQKINILQLKIHLQELIDLEEQMGHENTGLSEEEIQRHLKKRTYLSSANQFDLNEAPPSKTSRISVNQLDLNEACSDSDEEPDICVICQVCKNDSLYSGNRMCRVPWSVLFGVSVA